MGFCHFIGAVWSFLLFCLMLLVIYMNVTGQPVDVKWYHVSQIWISFLTAWYLAYGLYYSLLSDRDLFVSSPFMLFFGSLSFGIFFGIYGGIFILAGVTGFLAGLFGLEPINFGNSHN